MTRKDYIVIADIAIATIQTGQLAVPETEFVALICRKLGQTGGNFDPNKFRKYIEKRLGGPLS
jgi:hypothetical protein